MADNKASAISVARHAYLRRWAAGAGLSAEPAEFEGFLLGLETPALVALVTVVSVLSSELIAAAVAYLAVGYVPHVVTIAAILTPALVAPAASLLFASVIRHLRREVADRKSAEEALRIAIESAESANKTKSTFLAHTSHELRTPLNAIIGFSDMIRDGIGTSAGPEKIIEYAGHINESGRHLLAILNDILDLSKVEAGKLELYEEELDIAVAVGACVAMMQARAERGGLSVALKIAERLPVLRADGRKVKQVLLNLLSNAVKFTRPGGRITVALETDGAGAVTMSVADTGIGIAGDQLATALAPFSQVDSALNRKFEGTGLGLPLAKALVELHQGKFQIESAPGRGTTVCIVFPAARSIRRAA
jgi:signal transduction histidine kinase